MQSLKTDKKSIAIFAGGKSALNIPGEELKQIMENCFTVAINLYRQIPPDVRIWTDKEINEVIYKICILKQLPDDPMAVNILHTKEFLCRMKTFNHKPETKPIQLLNMHYFSRKKDKFKRNWTAYTAIQLFQKYMPKKKILLFGYDCLPQYQRQTRGVDGNIEEIPRDDFYNTVLKPFKDHLEGQYNTFPDRWKNVINCSKPTGLEFLPCQDWKTAINFDL